MSRCRGASRSSTRHAIQRSTTGAVHRKEVALDHTARIKVHTPDNGGALIELSGEFDVACLGPFGQALRRASGSGMRTFVDLAGVTFMDTLCLRELASRLDTDAGSLELCRPSWQFRLGVAACGMEGIFELPPTKTPAPRR